MNKTKKRTIVGVAIISGVILVSVSAVGTMKLINEKNAVEGKTYLTAETTAFESEQAIEGIQTITLGKNGGEGGISNLYVKDKKGHVYRDPSCADVFEVTQISIPKKVRVVNSDGTIDDYRFRGYKNDSDRLVVDQNGNIINMDEFINKFESEEGNDYKIIAQWEKVQTVTLNKNGGNGGPTYIYVSEDDNGYATAYSDPNCLSKITKINVPTKEGYIFKGYMFDEGETQIHILADGTLNNILGHYHASSSNYELKAIWEEESTDTTKPTITSVLGEKDSNGNYKVVIKATDESGIKKVTVNGNEITEKDSNGNYYFVPTDNGTYTIEVYNTKDNKTEYTYTEINILKEMKMTAEKDSNGNNIVYIETATNKGIKEVKVNENEITQRDETGRYVFKPTANGKYTVNVTYNDGTTESKEYEETRFTNSGSEDNNGNDNNGSNNNGSDSNGSNNNGNDSNGSNNNGNDSNGSNSDGSGNSGINNNGNSNSGSNSNGSSNNKSSSSENGTTSGQSGTSGNTISTSTALTTLPKTGTKLGALYAIIASGISTVFAWFKSKKIK